MDKDSAIERTVQQGKKPNLQKRAPKKIKKKKNFIDRLILKEKEIEEDVVVNKTSVSDINKPSSNIIKKNIQALKSMAEKEGLSVNDLIRLLKNE
jgi:predicted XRE-type DNA-binding protein